MPRLRHLIEKGLSNDPLPEGNKGLAIPLRRKNGRWEVGLSQAEQGDYTQNRGEVTLHGWRLHQDPEGKGGFSLKEAKEFITSHYEAGAKSMIRVDSGSCRIADNDLYVLFDDKKEADLTWMNHNALLDLQLAKIKPSYILSDTDLLTCLCSILRKNVINGGVAWEQHNWHLL